MEIKAVALGVNERYSDFATVALLHVESGPALGYMRTNDRPIFDRSILHLPVHSDALRKLVTPSMCISVARTGAAVQVAVRVATIKQSEPIDNDEGTYNCGVIEAQRSSMNIRRTEEHPAGAGLGKPDHSHFSEAAPVV